VIEILRHVYAGGPAGGADESSEQQQLPEAGPQGTATAAAQAAAAADGAGAGAEDGAQPEQAGGDGASQAPAAPQVRHSFQSLQQASCTLKPSDTVHESFPRPAAVLNLLF
jgi:hypothetical protein